MRTTHQRLSIQSRQGDGSGCSRTELILPIDMAKPETTAVSRPTTEAEIVSLDAGVFGEGLPVQVLCEILANKPVDLICYSPKLRHLSKTHKIDLGSLHEVLQNNHVQLRHIATDKQLADIFTKALPPAKWPAALNLMHMQYLPSQHAGRGS